MERPVHLEISEVHRHILPIPVSHSVHAPDEKNPTLFPDNSDGVPASTVTRDFESV